MTYKRLFQIFSLGLVTTLVSCEECKDCSFEQRIFFSNNPAISKITNQKFSKIDFFKTVTTPHELEEVCGDNLDNFNNKTLIDTVYIDSYRDNEGNNVVIPGGVTRLTSRKFSCK